MAKKRTGTSSLSDVISKFSVKKSQPVYDIRPDALNKAWGKVHLGTLYGMWAMEGAGKTTITAQAMVSLLKQGLKGIFIDVEKAFNENQQTAFKLKEYVDNGDLLVVTVKNFAELEEVVLALPGSGLNFLCIDSWSAVKPYTDAGLRVTDVRPGLSALQESFMINKLKEICYMEDIAGFVLAHARANIQIGHVNMYAPAQKMAGGHSFKHMLEVVTEISTHGKIKNDDDEIVGIEITIQTSKNKWTAPFVPYREKMYYGIGIDPRYSIVDRALELGIISKEGRTIRTPAPFEGSYNRKTIYEAPIEVLRHLKELIAQRESE